jgi:energy-coupling factor transport system ATP-binding protein
VGWNPIPLTVRDARIAARARLAAPAPIDRARARAGIERGRLRVAGLSAAYGDTPALRDVWMDVGAGEIVALMGRNGAGKTTLLRCVAGLHHPIAGTVAVDDHPPRPGVDGALCPQEPESILFADTVAEEIAVTLRARGLPGSPGEVLDGFGIGVLGSRHPRDLSAGERLLVATAATAAGRAPLLLLDEPTRGLDPEAKTTLVAFLRTHAAGGGSVLIATHDVELAAAAATRVVMLAGGEVVADGDPASVLGDSTVFAPQMTRVFGTGWLTPEQVAEALA